MGGGNDYHFDFYRMTGTLYKKNFHSFLSRCLRHNLAYMRLFRKYQKKPTFFKRFRLYRITKKYGLEISVNAKIGKGLYLGHPYNITVGGDVVIGDNVNLNKGCTIGATNRGYVGSPKIGNNVYIGINATVVGNINIGDDVLIAPNSYVNFDVPSHSVVIGNPATIHFKENATKGYVNFLV